MKISQILKKVFKQIYSEANDNINAKEQSSRTRNSFKCFKDTFWKLTNCLTAGNALIFYRLWERRHNAIYSVLHSPSSG